MVFAGDETAFQIGLALGAASILSLGPNSLLILREGMGRGRVVLVAATVAASFLLLLSLSHLLAAQLNAIGDTPRRVLAFAGIALIAYRASRCCLHAGSASAVAGMDREGREPVLACLHRVLAWVWTNPLTYLERLILPAALGQSFSAPAQAEFVAALMLMALFGCGFYAVGGWGISRMLQHERRMRHFDMASGVILLVLAAVAAFRLLGADP